jgi:disulfide bond formation protein DsbB
MPQGVVMTDKQTLNLSRLINIAALFALLGVLAGSLHLQFGVGEQPCPLCLVQRSAMIGLAVGPVMNLLWGIKARHYALSILAAVAGGAASTRQILLHIADPADPGYGPEIFGWHLYTWAFVTFLVGVVGCAVLIMWNRPFELNDKGVLSNRRESPKWMPFLALWSIIWVVLNLVIIAVSVVPECGLGMCPDDPPVGPSVGDIAAWILILGVGVIAAVIAIFVERFTRAKEKLLS